ncbi:MAG: precorrin-3B synthase [Pseudomonadota bacterium]
MDDALPQSHPSASRPSACPGLLRIAQALDGGICRIKLPGGQLSCDQAVAITEAAEQCASGVIEATNRANLQIRGVRVEQEQALIDRLLEAGLGPRPADPAATAAADDVSNLMLSPAAGIDPAALLDTRPLAEKLLALLQNDSRLHRLSAKFALQLDGGEQLAMLEHPHDLWLSAMGGADSLFAFGLAGCPPLTGSDEPALAAVPLARVPALVGAVLALFLELAGPEQTRMRQLLVQLPAADFLQQLQARLDFPLSCSAELSAWRRPVPPAWQHLGIQAQLQPGLCHVGGLPPLGRLDSAMLRGLAQLARDKGDASLRLTPWQGLLLPNIRQADGPEVLQRLEDLGLTCRPDRPLARLIACSGSSGCAKGLADTKGDALRLATLLPQGLPSTVHLSGCPRSCAAAHCAPHTLLAASAGRYDLYRSAPALPGFGQLLARHLSLEEASQRLATLSALETHR